jgi:hypothetical protein
MSRIQSSVPTAAAALPAADPAAALPPAAATASDPLLAITPAPVAAAALPPAAASCAGARHYVASTSPAAAAKPAYHASATAATPGYVQMPDPYANTTGMLNQRLVENSKGLTTYYLPCSRTFLFQHICGLSMFTRRRLCAHFWDPFRPLPTLIRVSSAPTVAMCN